MKANGSRLSSRHSKLADSSALNAKLALVVVVGLASVGLGATALTRLGTRPLYRSYLVQG